MGNCHIRAEEPQKKEINTRTKFDLQREDCSSEVEAYLNQVPLLNPLSQKEKRLLGSNLQKKKYNSKQNIVVEGDQGNEFFIIKDGICSVLKYDNEKKMPIELCKLQKGDYFGEGALLTNSARAATIQSVSPVCVLCLDRQQFQTLFGEKRLAINFAKRKAVSAEPYNPEKENKEQHIPKDAFQTKNAEQKQLILNVVQKNILFGKMSLEQKDKIVEHMWLKQVSKGTSVIKQGDLGDNFYIVKKGNFDIFVKNKQDGKVNKVCQTGIGKSFGDLALMHNAPRAATVTALVDSDLWSLDRWTFRKILTMGFRDKILEYEQFLKQVPYFDTLLSQERSKVAEALEEVKYPKGHDIIKENEEGDKLFILKTGEVIATKRIEGEVKEVKRYHDGDFFGERALLKKEVRAATCTTVCDSECLYMGRKAFELLLGPLEDIFENRDKNYEKVNQHMRESSITCNKNRILESKSLIPDKGKSHKIDFDKLEIIGTLGKGSFGHVQLVKDPQGTTYALKAVSKYQVVKMGQQTHMLGEKNVMEQLNHPFLIKLYGTHQNNDYIYFLLEPCLGGELFSLLRAQVYFPEKTARFYAAAVVLCFEYMHSKNIIYRDLKPENLLLDRTGYLKITDFGFAKIVHDRTWTLCGTPDYLAPEVVSGQGHSKGVDWWTLGILIYEMLASYPPFYDEDPMKTYSKIMQGQPSFPMHFTKPSVELIRRLLQPKQTRRLGVGKGGIRRIKKNLWFIGFNWTAFLKRKMKPPIIQKVQSDFDLSNFEEYPEEDQQYPPYKGDPDNPNWDKSF